MSVMWKIRFSSGTDMIKIYSKAVIKCQKNNLLYRPTNCHCWHKEHL